MTKHLITLQQIRDQRPCENGWKTLLTSLGNPKDLSLQVSIGDVAKSNGAQDAFWCCRCIDDRRFLLSLIMPALKRASVHTDDSRVHDCISALEKWLAGDESIGLLAAADAARAAYAAADAAYAAADAARAAYAAADAAYAAADAADAADAAARAAYAAADAAYAAADAADAEGEQQVCDIIALSPTHALKGGDA